jgi:AsmA protein
MQSNQAPNAPPSPENSKAPLPPRPAFPAMSRRTRLVLIAAGTVVGAALLTLVAVNLLISADWVRDRVANRIKEQTGRELTVNGTTSLLFTPGPHVVITDATFTDPEERAGTTDVSVGRLLIDLSLIELMSRNVDSERVVLERPVVTVRLGDDGRKAEPKKPKTAKAPNPNPKPRRDVKLKDVRIEDGTVNIVYGGTGKERRIEHITGNLSLPTLTAPFTGSGKFDWKDQTVNFSFELTSVADLREKRPARLLVALETPALAARFDGSLITRPDLSGQGELSAKAHSIPSLLAWMREKPASVTGIGDGELASHVAWKDGEITFSNSRFALEHAKGQGQAVVTLRAPRPHIRAALALEHLDLNPFLASGPKAAGADRNRSQSEPRAAPQTEKTPADAEGAKDWFTKPDAGQSAGASEGAQEPAPSASAGQPAETASTAPLAAPVARAPAADAAPASFDADVNLNVRKTRVFHLELGPSSLGLAFRDGVLNATLGGMELYDGHASGKLVLDASKPVPAFNGDFVLDGVQAKSLLSDAAQFSMLEGRTKLALQLSGAGGNTEEIKSSLAGQGSIAVSDGAIEGVNLTEMIDQVGAGEIPDLRQGPGAKTAFSDLGGSFTVKDGIAETNNLTATSPLMKVTASGTVNIVESRMDLLAKPEIVAGPEGERGANDLAGLSVPVRIEGPLDRPTIRPEVKEMFADPEKAGKTVNQIGKAIQKKFKGKPVGEAIGRFLGDIKIEQRGNGENGGSEAQADRRRSGKKETQQATPDAEAGAAEQDESAEPEDPEIEDLLR